MKVLIVNRNYFVTGGPEKYMFSLIENMPEHEFMPFCVKFDQNIETPYSKYFLEPPGGSSNVYFNDFQMSFFKKSCFALNMVYSFSARNKLYAMIKDVQPDIALFLNGVYFTDSIIDACRKHNVPIIWRLSDFHKICANYLLFRDGKVCDLCLEKGLFEIIRNQCGGYQHSLGVSLVKYAGMKLSQLRNIYDYISYFIVPSSFSRKKMIQGGFPQDKIIHIPTFININQKDSLSHPGNANILYVGRLSPEKGVDVLIKAFGQMKNKNAALLKIAGEIKSDYADTLISSIPDSLKSRIKFLGFKNQKEISELFSKCSMFIVPSVWYENQPNVVLEGMAYAKPAIVSKLGSLVEMVKHGSTGYHFKVGNSDDLAGKMDELIENSDVAVKMGKNAFEYVKAYHSKEKHIASINDLFNKCRK